MNIKLIQFTSADFADYYQLVGDERVMAMITERAIPREEAEVNFEKILINNKIHADFGCFKLVNTDDNVFIGLAKLKIASEDNSQAELGYMLLPEFWGKGIAGGVAKILIGFARTHPKISSLIAIVDPNNTPSRKILINNGFVHKEYKDFDGLSGEILVLEFDSAPL